MSKAKLATGSFLWMVERLRQHIGQNGWIYLHGGSRVFIVTTQKAILEAVQLEKQGLLSRQNFTTDLISPILGDGIFSCSESDWRCYKKSTLRYLRPSSVHRLAWRRLAREATLRALEESGNEACVPAVAFCRGILQDVLLPTLFGAVDLDKRTVYHLAHCMDAMSEAATFCFLVFGRTFGKVLARPFQWFGHQAYRKLAQIVYGAVQHSSTVYDHWFYRNIPSLLFAGQDTTATAMALVLWVLSVNQAEQAKIRQEVLNLGSESPLLRQTIANTLHCFPPVHTLPTRTAVQDIEIDGIRVSKWSEIVYCVWMAHQDPGPRDFSFGIGPKRCPGEHLALAAISEAVACMLERCRLLPASNERVVLGAKTVLVPKNLKLRIERVESTKHAKKI